MNHTRYCAMTKLSNYTVVIAWASPTMYNMWAGPDALEGAEHS